MRFLYRVFLLTASVALLYTISAPPSLGILTWSYEIVDSTAVLTGPSLALDSYDNPHIAYIVTETGSYYSPPLRFILKYASWNGSAWNTQIIDAENASGIEYSSLTFDSKNHAHVVYNSFELIKYAYWTGNNWSIQTIDTGARAVIALDSSDNPHLAYTGENGLLTYASWNGIDWTIQKVDPESNRPLIARNNGRGSNQYLALDSHDKPYIVYSVNSTVKLAVENQSGWDIKEVISNEGLHLGTLALDSSGNPHFTYVLTLTNTLVYTYWNGSDWSSQEISHVFLAGSFIALDSNNNPHVTYVGSSPAPEQTISVYYAKRTRFEWEIQRVTDDYMTANTIPFALNSLGNPHIGYLSVRVTGSTWIDATLYHETSNQLSPASTLNLEPSPSIPELHTWITFPILIAIAATTIALKRKNVKKLFTTLWLI